MKWYISLVGELASVRIQDYAGLLASKLAYLPTNWLILTKTGLLSNFTDWLIIKQSKQFISVTQNTNTPTLRSFALQLAGNDD